MEKLWREVYGEGEGREIDWRESLRGRKGYLGGSEGDTYGGKELGMEEREE